MSGCGYAVLCSSIAVCVAFLCVRACADAGVEFQECRFEEHGFQVAAVDIEEADLELYWKRPDETPIASFGALNKWIEDRGKRLLFATNAGIFSSDYTPGGLHIADGKTLSALNTRDGKGNFHLKPNGVFYIDDAGAHVVSTERYQALQPSPHLATQSGPLLVIDGALHPKFQADSANVHIRSGVGVCDAGHALFALSEEPVTFHLFARFFKKGLACPDALYLDGDISRFYIPGRSQQEAPSPLVGFLAIIEDSAKTKPEENK